MNDGLQHAECAEALGAYALGALPEAEAEQVSRHLAGCSECRGELEVSKLRSTSSRLRWRRSSRRRS